MARVLSGRRFRVLKRGPVFWWEGKYFSPVGGTKRVVLGIGQHDEASLAFRGLDRPLRRLRFQSNLHTNGTIDEQGRFWVVDEYVQVFEFVDSSFTPVLRVRVD